MSLPGNSIRIPNILEPKKPQCRIEKLELPFFVQFCEHGPEPVGQPVDSCRGDQVKTHYFEVNLKLHRTESLPITIINNDNISSSKVDTKSSCSSRQKKDKFLTSWLVESFNWSITIFTTSISINSAVIMSTEDQVVFKNVQQPCHLSIQWQRPSSGFVS